MFLKKSLFVQFLVGIVLSAQLYSADLPPIRVYGGLSVGSVKTTDFNNFCISDWEKYGLLSKNASSQEGRVIVGLKESEDKYKYSGMKIGAFIGADKDIFENGQALVEFQYNMGTNFSMMGISLGLNYDLVNGENFKLGITPKIGYSIGSVDLGLITSTYIVYNDGTSKKYTDPVIITEGSFAAGDKIKTDIGSLVASFGVTPSYKLTDKLGLRAFIGMGFGIGGSSKITVQTSKGDVNIDMTSKAVVQYGTGSTQAGFTPSVSPSGLILQIGLSYKL